MESGTESTTTFEQDFTRRLFSLFGSLFDPRASPFLGPVPVSASDENDQEDDIIPPFESSLCDYRLRSVYKAEMDSRKTTLEDLSAKSDQVVDNSNNPNFNQEIVLGDKLPPRSITGKTSDAELASLRRENEIKRAKMAEMRRQKQIEYRSQLMQERRERDRKDYLEDLKLIMKRDQELKKANKAKADAMREKMRIRREKEKERREREMLLQEEASTSVRSVSYRTQVADRTDFHTRMREHERIRNSNLSARHQAEKVTMEQNKKAAKPNKPQALKHSNRLPLG